MAKIEAKVEFILEMIDNIDFIVKRHKNITNALWDIKEQMAILMTIAQIGKTLKKINNDIIKKHDLVENKEGVYYTKNSIVHDYEGVDLAFIDNILREYIPKLKEKYKK